MILSSRGEHRSPAKNHKETFPLSYFCMTKSTKSHLRGLSSLLKIFFRVHELAARAMRGKCVRHRAELKFAMSRFPRFRLYHACEHSARKSRADSCTHCSARPLKVQGGRGSSACADGMKSVFFLFGYCYIRVLCGRRCYHVPLIMYGKKSFYIQ